jgi:hypothetical protein
MGTLALYDEINLLKLELARYKGALKDIRELSDSLDLRTTQAITRICDEVLSEVSQ